LGKKVIIGDGAIGSLLQQHITGDFIPDELNLSKPDLVERLHYDYASAGADYLTTNTFGASPLKLKDIGLVKKFKNINAEAVKIARRMADMKETWVAGNIGPSGKLIEPLGDLTFDDMKKNYAAQAKILENSGADFILLQTITDIQAFRAAVVGILSTVKIPVLASMSFTNDDLSMSGTDGRAFAVTSDFIGLSAIGANCGTSLKNMKRVVEKIAHYSYLPILCQPNAGLPVVENGKTVFKVKPEEFADFMEEIYGLGVSVLGSCCGSTPEFTKELSEKFKGREVLKRDINKNLDYPPEQK
jgi:5-methyltetrahydrofolate--homocysteine methyltransferase